MSEAPKRRSSPPPPEISSDPPPPMMTSAASPPARTSQSRPPRRFNPTPGSGAGSGSTTGSGSGSGGRVPGPDWAVPGSCPPSPGRGSSLDERRASAASSSASSSSSPVTAPDALTGANSVSFVSAGSPAGVPPSGRTDCSSPAASNVGVQGSAVSVETPVRLSPSSPWPDGEASKGVSGLFDTTETDCWSAGPSEGSAPIVRGSPRFREITLRTSSTASATRFLRILIYHPDFSEQKAPPPSPDDRLLLWSRCHAISLFAYMFGNYFNNI